MMKGPPPTWDLYAAFISVMRTGSLSAAARELGAAQPTVRRQIADLEKALGCVLFTRSKAGLLPTEAARETMPYAQTMAATADALVRAVSGGRTGARGVVRITCSEVLGAEVLPRILAPLAHAHPEIEIELSPTDRNEDLMRGDADVAVRMARPSQSALLAKLAAKIDIGLFASKAYLEKYPAPKTRSALTKQHRLIGDDRGQAIVSALRAHGMDVARQDFFFRTDDSVAQLAAIRAGLGIGPCQAPLARRTSPPLRRVLPSVRVDLDAWVVMHEDLKDVRRIRLVFDALVEGLAAYARTAAHSTAAISRIPRRKT